MTVAPSGEQHTIEHGDMRVTVVEVGGGLRMFAAGDLEVIDGFSEGEMCRDGRGNILIPWPNRLAGGKYEFERQSFQLPLTEPARGNAIHGLVRWANWRLEDREDDWVRLGYRLHPSTGYPFSLDLAVTYALSNAGLHVTLSTVNIGSQPCPFGAGQHPYVRVGTPLVNEATLHVPAETIHEYDDKSIPTKRLSVRGTQLDFRTPRPISDTVIDMDYTDLERGEDGMARVTVQAPNGGPTVEVWMDTAFKHATVYTGGTVQPPARRRQGIAIEPMTCPSNAFNSGQDLIVLQPGERWQGNWGIRVSTNQ